MKTPQDIRDFWFSDAVQPFWFARSEEIDARIASDFSDTYEAAHRGDLDHWMGTAPDALALVIALDQFPRNLFRGSGRSFESNDIALAHARTALDRAYDQALSETERQFFYLPFMHSEDLADQDRSVKLYESLGNENALDFAHQHRDIIAQFARFPHRNAVLGRSDTPEEAEFLKTHTGF
ncbi:DUF924 domain-containing protein [Aquicoccus porphyridii]|uniref:DUF924 domain-containing protein n=1 Tax=Aquicoccus porphyridii TaxID=1852029 RepID=A0A5A9ZC36_9RHOB|nr:DUF924 family protein [Aquicoccus porphyridii]KAA0914670.1 DUF924 domain-containing protein [Aquicoccus porphyridii]RAI53289.1 DUF924 domain-containing protein [Rhodobacteraceae bacterium AsT-22]